MKVLHWLDDAWLRIERAFVVVGLLVMALVVSADVLHRKLVDPAWKTPGRVLLVVATLVVLVTAALRSARGQRSTFRRLLARALAVSAGLALGAWAFVTVAPNGLIWSQRLALVLMLWVAFFGASIATREHRHLKMEVGERLLRGRAARYARTLAHAVAALAAGALAWLSARYCAFLYGEYVVTEGAAGRFDELPIPHWLAYGVLPLSLGVMALRFAGHAIGAARANPPTDIGDATAEAE